MVTIVRDESTRIGKDVKTDSGRRVVLPKRLVEDGVTYRVYANEMGQILLDPQVTIPASEAWLFEDKAALAALDKGMAESASGHTIDRGSFAQYVEDAP